ncbi:MAG: SDR family NAD(P)-dependent oxidoreductase [Oscillospiraceae bacterium]|nr:SDR family NAD(P)-dependent oxidoreductase [Oscillospiraceae bacterium]
MFVITGAAGGIGFATAHRAAEEGAKLVLADRKEEMSKTALEKLMKITSDVTFLILDLSAEENCKELIDTAWNKYGRIDVLINNAGITGIPAPVHTMGTQMFMEVMACNVYSAFFCSHYALAHMIEQGGASCVVNVSSVAGLTGFPGHSAYVTSKHALSGLTKNMAMDYAKYGIRVNAVNPGTTDTPMYQEALAFLSTKKAAQAKETTPSDKPICPPKIVSAQARVAAATEVSDVILFLASDEASNMTGTTVPVDGGFVCF